MAYILLYYAYESCVYWKNYIKCGISAHMKKELFYENEVNQSEFFKIKIRGNVLYKTSLHENITPFNRHS